MTSTVRAVQDTDLPQLAQIEDAADRILIDLFRADDWPPAAPGADRAAQPGFILVVARGEGEIIGFVHVLETSGICHIEQLSVAPEHARRGWGRALVEAAQSQAQARGFGTISLRTYADVPWNGPFYASMGFTEEHPRTPFHRSLVALDAALGLDRFGRRVHMVAQLFSAAQEHSPRTACAR